MEEEQKIINEGLELLLPIYGKWHVLREYQDELFEITDQGSGSLVQLDATMREGYMHLLEEYEKNRIASFLPHGGQTSFINDRDNGFCFLLAPNQVGKSLAGVVWSALRIIKTDPDWMTYDKTHGLEFKEYRGKKTWVVASYSWDSVQTLYEHYQMLLPRSELMNYSPEWGKFKGENGSQKTLVFGARSGSQILPLKCGSKIKFLCYSQKQSHWEGFRADGAQLDEQSPRSKVVGLKRAFTTRGNFCQIGCTLTGHVLEDRPDTGAAGWMKTELWDAKETVMGCTVGRHQISIDQVPDAIISAKTKHELWVQWVKEPNENKNEAQLREANARYHGGWQEGSGLVISNFYPEHHIIPEMPMNNVIVRETTNYRGIDHGLGNPCACLWGKVFPWGDLVIHREYYKISRGIIPEHAKDIVELSNNILKKTGVYKEVKSGGSFDIMEEVFNGEHYHKSVLDGRSFRQPGQETDRNIGRQHNDYGLYCTPAKGWRNDRLVPLILARMEPQKERKHIMYEFRKRGIITEEKYQQWLKGRKGDFLNAPSLYFTSNLNFVFKEMRSWANGPNGKPEDKNSHLMDALKYMIAENPRFCGDPTKPHYMTNGMMVVEEGEKEEDREDNGYKYVRY
jgi:hypothetical protein